MSPPGRGCGGPSTGSGRDELSCVAINRALTTVGTAAIVLTHDPTRDPVVELLRVRHKYLENLHDKAIRSV